MRGDVRVGGQGKLTHYLAHSVVEDGRQAEIGGGGVEYCPLLRRSFDYQALLFGVKVLAVEYAHIPSDSAVQGAGCWLWEDGWART